MTGSIGISAERRKENGSADVKRYSIDIWSEKTLKKRRKTTMVRMGRETRSTILCSETRCQRQIRKRRMQAFKHILRGVRELSVKSRG